MFTLILGLALQAQSYTANADDFLDRYPDCKVLEQEHCDRKHEMIGHRIACYRQVMTLGGNCIARVKKQVNQGMADLKAIESRRKTEFKIKATEAVQKGYGKYTGKRLESTQELVVERTVATDRLRAYVGYLNRQILPLYEQSIPKVEKLAEEIGKADPSKPLPDVLKAEYQRVDRDLDKLITNQNAYFSEFNPHFQGLKFNENRESFLSAMEALQRYSLEAQSARGDLKQLIDQFKDVRKPLFSKTAVSSKVSKLEYVLQKMIQNRLSKGSQDDFNFFKRLCLKESSNQPERCELGDNP